MASKARKVELVYFQNWFLAALIRTSFSAASGGNASDKDSPEFRTAVVFCDIEFVIRLPMNFCVLWT